MVKVISLDLADLSLHRAHFIIVMLLSMSLSISYLTGYARVHYAEFVGLGSDGFSTKSDPRFGLSYVNTGNKRDSKPSSLYHNSFHDLYNAGFGAFGTSGYEMFDNVVYKSVGQCKSSIGMPYSTRKHSL